MKITLFCGFTSIVYYMRSDVSEEPASKNQGSWMNALGFPEAWHIRRQ